MNRNLVEELKKKILLHLQSNFAKELSDATKLDLYQSFVYAIRDILIEKWIKTKKEYNKTKAKSVCYLSMEFLMGRALVNALINLGLYDEGSLALKELGINLKEIEENEQDAGLGNGGLGRLAACFLDSLTTLEYPAFWIWHKI
ncbi:MAG: hypothetical protein KatS3mg068_1816 [Candidatus Sericytochromatia bacterium]|nr:MAG: hypothetical protein KatS3mg068_1816 [Candidatus Sericytochromatia bacterium]